MDNILTFSPSLPCATVGADGRCGAPATRGWCWLSGDTGRFTLHPICRDCVEALQSRYLPTQQASEDAAPEAEASAWSGAKLREKRMARGWSQTRLAHELREAGWRWVTNLYISKFETGKRAPTAGLRAAIDQVLREGHDV